MSAQEFPIHTGNPQQDQQLVAQMQQQYAAAGMQMTATPMPGGGYMVRVGMPSAPTPQPAYGASPQGGYGAPPGHGAQPQAYGAQPQAYGAQPQAYGAPAQPYGAQPQAYGAGGYGAQAAAVPQGYGAGAQAWGAQPQAPAYQAPAYQAPAYQAQAAGYGALVGGHPAAAGGMVNAVAGAVAEAAASLGEQRVKYLRKVYGLLAAACVLAVGSGWAVLNLMPTVTMTSPEGKVVQVPLVVSLMLTNNAVFWGAFALLVVATAGASAVSKIPIVNVVALFLVAIIMGVELSDMVFVAQYYAGIGDTLTANPVRDAGIMTVAVFGGITGYIFIARKDFSYLYAALSMGFIVILVGCILTFVLKSEVFALAVATGGALLSAGFMLYVTSYIFRNSEMDDPVGDALAILVQLRNLFMFLLRIFMSSRD
jgi:modulator of FtsH protease